MPEAKTLESASLPDRRSIADWTHTLALAHESYRTLSSPKADSMHVVSAVELVQQPCQRDKAEPEANEHEPPSKDRSQDNGHERE
jgi:hypothetical protein